MSPLASLESVPAADGPQPPHPFRDPAWYDPRVEHRPCLCPRCQPAKAARSGRLAGRVVLVVLGGIVLPLASLVVNGLLMNTGHPVVAHGLGGTLLLLLSVASVTMQLILAPMRRGLSSAGPIHCPPASTRLRLLLLSGLLVSTLFWGYLSLLFLPLLPISIIGLVWGIGLCGLCPYLALAVSLVQSLRAARAVRARCSRRATATAVLLPLILPVAIAAGIVLHGGHQQRQIDQTLDAVARSSPFSSERMELISSLAGAEPALVKAYFHADDRDKRELIAEAYLRLTDSTINASVESRAAGLHGEIHPFWFIDQTPVFSGGLWRF